MKFKGDIRTTSEYDSLSGAENMCLYPSEKHFQNGLLC